MVGVTAIIRKYASAASKMKVWKDFPILTRASSGASDWLWAPIWRPAVTSSAAAVAGRPTTAHRSRPVPVGLPRRNPAQYAERPRAEEQEIEILTPPEIRRLLDAADEPARTLLLCAVLAGMRRGELLGLRWEDVDLEGHRIYVRRALWRGKFVTPKSRRSRRAIDVAPTLRPPLTRLSSRFNGGLVFCSSDGKPIDPDNFVHRVWARMLRRR